MLMPDGERSDAERWPDVSRQCRDAVVACEQWPAEGIPGKSEIITSHALKLVLDEIQKLRRHVNDLRNEDREEY